MWGLHYLELCIYLHMEGLKCITIFGRSVTVLTSHVKKAGFVKIKSVQYTKERVACVKHS